MGTLAAHQLHFTYPQTDTPIVADWSDEFPAGSTTAITGESGCGKSTRLYLLALMTKPTSGQVLLDGARVENLGDSTRAHIRAHRFGFLFQDALLDPSRTVFDNIVEGAIYRGENPAALRHRVLALLDELHVDIPLDRKPAQISGGQAQRIALCRALLGEPDVLFADEPTGNLDMSSTALVLNVLRAQADKGAAVIVVTHDREVVQWADRSRHLQYSHRTNQ